MSQTQELSRPINELSSRTTFNGPIPCMMDRNSHKAECVFQKGNYGLNMEKTTFSLFFTFYYHSRVFLAHITWRTTSQIIISKTGTTLTPPWGLLFIQGTDTKREGQDTYFGTWLKLSQFFFFFFSKVSASSRMILFLLAQEVLARVEMKAFSRNPFFLERKECTKL